MRKLSAISSLTVLAGFFLVFSLMLAVPAQARWFWTHGHSGHVEDDTWALTMRIAEGLEVEQIEDTSNTVHFAVPTIGQQNWKARYVKIHFWAEDSTIEVTAVRIFNGKKSISTLTGSWSNGEHLLNLDMGEYKSFRRGMGISVDFEVAYAGGFDYHKIEFYGVGANFKKN
jgi:hypothetical protein